MAQSGRFGWPWRPSRDPFVPRELRSHAGYLSRRQWAFAVAYLGYSAAYLVRNNFKITSGTYVGSEGWSLTDVGIVLTGFTVAYGIGKIVMGLVVDRFPLSRVFSIALATSGLLCIVMGFTTDPGLMSWLMIANGTVQGACAPAALAMVGAWYPNPLRASRVAFWNTSQNLGAALLPAVFGIGSATLVGGSTRLAFVLPGILGIGIAVWIYRTDIDRPWRDGYSTLPMMFGRAGVPEIPVESDRYIDILVTHVLRSRPILTLVFVNTALYCIRFGVINWLVIVAADRGLGTRQGEWIYFYVEVAAIPASFLFGYIAWKLPNKMSRVGALSMAVLAAALALWPAVDSPGATVAVALTLGALMYGPQIIVNVLTLNFVPARAVGVATGIVGASGYLVGEMSANLAIPHIVEHFGWSTVYGCLAVLALACMVAYWSLGEAEGRYVITDER